MVSIFDVPLELSEFVQQAASAAAEVVETERPGEIKLTGLLVLGRFDSSRLMIARRVLSALIQRHVWCNRKTLYPYRQDYACICITFSNAPPFNGDSIPLTQSMTGWLIGQCHSSISRRQEKCVDDMIEKADQILATSYAPNERLDLEVRILPHRLEIGKVKALLC